MRIVGWTLIILGGINVTTFLTLLFRDIISYPGSYPFKEAMISGNFLGMRVFPLEQLVIFLGMLVIGILILRRRG